MEIKFTKEQYENLIKLVYLGNWMISAVRQEDRAAKKFTDLEQYIYSFAQEAGLGGLVERDEETEEYFPARGLEEDTEIERYREEYDDYTFWDELECRLARRDLLKQCGEYAVRKMTYEELLRKEQPLLGKYNQEFEKYGIERLRIFLESGEGK